MNHDSSRGAESEHTPEAGGLPLETERLERPVCDKYRVSAKVGVTSKFSRQDTKVCGRGSLQA
jgi:hypothetical protein